MFTVMWNDEQGVPRIKYIDNFCTDGSKRCDSLFVRAVWKYHLSNKDPTGEFVGVTHLLRTGDSGPHFQSKVSI